MIGKLRGIIDNILDDKCLLDVNGVFYLVFISFKTAEKLRKLEKNSVITLVIETVVKEDAIELYGFFNEQEKIWFLELTKVQGVGAKMGQKILSSLSIEEIAKALVVSDVKAFTNISGIGPKLATRITTELKESAKKLGIEVNVGEFLNQENLQISNKEIVADTISALENLGYKKHDCLKIINHFYQENSQITLENLITLSLRELSKKRNI
jgi:Holliday junction DNA helicase RuvA